jgi:hypothetical protein
LDPYQLIPFLYRYKYKIKQFAKSEDKLKKDKVSILDSDKKFSNSPLFQYIFKVAREKGDVLHEIKSLYTVYEDALQSKNNEDLNKIIIDKLSELTYSTVTNAAFIKNEKTKNDYKIYKLKQYLNNLLTFNDFIKNNGKKYTGFKEVGDDLNILKPIKKVFNVNDLNKNFDDGSDDVEEDKVLY